MEPLKERNDNFRCVKNCQSLSHRHESMMILKYRSSPFLLDGVSKFETKALKIWMYDVWETYAKFPAVDILGYQFSMTHGLHGLMAIT